MNESALADELAQILGDLIAILALPARRQRRHLGPRRRPALRRAGYHGRAGGEPRSTTSPAWARAPRTWCSMLTPTRWRSATAASGRPTPTARSGGATASMGWVPATARIDGRPAMAGRGDRPAGRPRAGDRHLHLRRRRGDLGPHGMAFLRQAGHVRPDVLILGAQTENQMIVAERGVLWARVTTAGRAAHAGQSRCRRQCHPAPGSPDRRP